VVVKGVKWNLWYIGIYYRWREVLAWCVLRVPTRFLYGPSMYRNYRGSESLLYRYRTDTNPKSKKSFFLFYTTQPVILANQTIQSDSQTIQTVKSVRQSDNSDSQISQTVSQSDNSVRQSDNSDSQISQTVRQFRQSNQSDSQSVRQFSQSDSQISQTFSQSDSQISQTVS